MQKAPLLTFSLLGASLLAAAAFTFASGTTYAADPSAPPEGAVPQPVAAEHYEMPLGLSTDPVYLDDCAGPATDCCNPICKPYISGCCAANGCGLPKQGVITGKGKFAGASYTCGTSTFSL